MTAAIITEAVVTAHAEATAPEAGTIARGWAAWHGAVSTAWPESVRKAAIGAAMDLHDALDLYGALLNEDIHPAAEWHDLAGKDDALAVALERAAKGVAEWTDELVRVFPACAIVAAPAAGGERQ